MAPQEAHSKLTYKPKTKLEVFFTGAAVRIARDNKHIACACGEEVKIVEVDTGKVARTLAGDSEPVTALAISPDCKTLVSASRSLACRVWDLTTGSSSRTWKPHKAPVADIAIDASGGYCATASADRSVKVWDLEGGFCTHSFTGHSGVVLCTMFHPKQLKLFSAGDDGEVRVWDLRTKTCSATLKGHFSAVTSLAVSPDGWLLLSGGRDKVVNVWDVRTSAKVATVPVYEAVEGVVTLPLGSAFPGVAGIDPTALLQGQQTVVFATAGEKGAVRIWRSDTAQALYTQPRAAGVRVAADGTAPAGSELVDLALLPGGKGLMAATGDSRLLFLVPQEVNGKPGLALSRQLVGNIDEVTDVRFTRGPTEAPTALAVATNSEAIRLFDLDTLSCTADLLGHGDIVLAMDAAHLAEGRDLLASGAKDHEARLWDAATGTCLAVAKGHVGAVSAVALSRKAKGKLLATAGVDKLLKVWDVAPVLAADWGAATGPLQLRTTAAVAAHDKDINALAFAPNDTLIATGSQDKTTRLWRLPSLTPAAVLRGHKRGIWSVEFSPVDQAVITASGDKTVKLWSIHDGACLKTFEGHTSGVLRAMFATAGTQVLSCGADGLLKLWAIRTAECLNTFEAHDDKIWALTAGGPHEAMLATGGGDASVVVWEDTTVADAKEQAEEEGLLAQREQELENAIVDEDYAQAARVAFELKHPGRLLGVLQRAARTGMQSSEVLNALVAHMPPQELRTALEYCREWNTNAKHCHVAQAMLQALLASRPQQDLLAVSGVRELLDGLLAYTTRHYARVDRLLRSSFLLDITLASAGVLLPDTAAAAENEELLGAMEAATSNRVGAASAVDAVHQEHTPMANGLHGNGNGAAGMDVDGTSSDEEAQQHTQQHENQQQQQQPPEKKRKKAKQQADAQPQQQPGTDHAAASSSDAEDSEAGADMNGHHAPQPAAEQVPEASTGKTKRMKARGEQQLGSKGGTAGGHASMGEDDGGAPGTLPGWGQGDLSTGTSSDEEAQQHGSRIAMGLGASSSTAAGATPRKRSRTAAEVRPAGNSTEGVDLAAAPPVHAIAVDSAAARPSTAKKRAKGVGGGSRAETAAELPPATERPVQRGKGNAEADGVGQAASLATTPAPKKKQKAASLKGSQTAGKAPGDVASAKKARRPRHSL